MVSTCIFLRQSMASVPESGISQDSPPHVTCIISFSKGFICSGGAGTVHLFEKTEEKDFYKKTREIKIPVDNQSPDVQVSESQEIVNLTVSPSEETLVCSTKSSQLYCITMSTADLGKVTNPWLMLILFWLCYRVTHYCILDGKILQWVCCYVYSTCVCTSGLS